MKYNATEPAHLNHGFSPPRTVRASNRGPLSSECGTPHCLPASGSYLGAVLMPNAKWGDGRGGGWAKWVKVAKRYNLPVIKLVLRM